MLKKNRSAPDTAVIPVLYYPDVRGAVEWLTTALPFIERLRIADHRCQLVHGNGAIVVAKPGGHAEAAPATLQDPGAHVVMLRVSGIDELFGRAKAAGATAMEWEAEPLAVGFYEKMGGRHVRDSEPSPIWNRTIPVMALTLG